MARRVRTRHDQISLFRNGGKRRGAGRKPCGARSNTSHRARPVIDAANALHVTLRVAPEVGWMRRPAMFRAIRAASRTAAKRETFRIVHLTIQRTHLHLIVEAEDNEALARGMQGFKVSVARHVNRAMGDERGRRRGRVFADRYHLVVISSPTQMRRVLSYVLNNWRHHDDWRTAPGWLVDPYSTAYAFGGWRERAQDVALWPRGEYDWLAAREPRSWLLRDGWRRGCGGDPREESISVHEVPGA
jgi:REP element-mobilizing transposase RayT